MDLGPGGACPWIIKKIFIHSLNNVERFPDLDAVGQAAVPRAPELGFRRTDAVQPGEFDGVVFGFLRLGAVVQKLNPEV